MVTTAILRMACTPTCAMNPVTSMAPKRSRALMTMAKPRQMRRANSRMTTSAPTKPSSSHTTEKT